ncbi:hypothetical protein [Parasedimentitalea psychrophila]|uniref:Transporter n=1 Tax=Parasedimentitalea psychrophila TaxID=2997337 RepID=A0A9Y2P1U1_9RHOB|nr:hypothetical protein [Parasedimentitalea psychrophila]WIY24422.1 hypothetical protein QPJ95_17865 [Parasedimentitalea psychrophila]
MANAMFRVDLRKHLLRFLTTVAVLLPLSLHAQSDSASDAAQANNPLADIKAFNIQNYYIGEFTGLGNATGNQFVLRYAQPISIGDTKWLIRASLPYNSFPVGPGGQKVSAIGDFDIFAAYQFETGKPGVSFAIGPQVVAPTATDDRLGSDQWQLGVANVYFNATSPIIQYGYLLTWRGGVGDTHGRTRISQGAIQPFVFYQLGNGYYTGGAPIWSYNFKNDSYAVPIGIRLGKVTKRNKTVFNFFVEPQYTVAHKGNGLPKWQIYLALNMQFQ